MDLRRTEHLLALGRMYWPETEFYDRQKEVIHSLVENDETVVVAGNQLGKDFIAGFIAVTFFLSPWTFFPPSYVQYVESRRGNSPMHVAHMRRIVTTSVRDDHLDVLWAEIGRFLSTSKIPLMETRGGPLVINHHEIRLREDKEVKNPGSYLLGMVSAKGEGMAGHHAPYTMAIVDEASGVDDAAYSFAQGWAKKFFIFGNANPCNNFFRQAVKAGDLAASES